MHPGKLFSASNFSPEKLKKRCIYLLRGKNCRLFKMTSAHVFMFLIYLFVLIAGDKFRDMPFSQLLDLSLPFAEVGCDGEVCVAKADGSGGLLNSSTCAQQLLYEVGDPGAYITPDVVS